MTGRLMASCGRTRPAMSETCVKTSRTSRTSTEILEENLKLCRRKGPPPTGEPDLLLKQQITLDQRPSRIPASQAHDLVLGLQLPRAALFSRLQYFSTFRFD